MSQKHCSINLDFLLFRLISKSRHRSLARLLAMLAVIHYYSDLICPNKKTIFIPTLKFVLVFQLKLLKNKDKITKNHLLFTTLKLILFMKNIYII